MEYNGHLKTEVIITIPIMAHMNITNHVNVWFQNDSEAVFKSKPIGKLQYYRSGRVVLIFNGKEYELLKANEDKHHKVTWFI